ncbi:DUF7336 domain-containing protein [Enterococcus sp. DIV0800]|uniref:DUF7336 domain-containing protein n=1 Tax=unclassified Enterococcus TaxID=2608891 RepID=UPI003D2FE1B9
MKVYIVWKVSISGWDKRVEGIFTTKEKAAAAFKNSWFKTGSQFTYTIEEIELQ